MALNILCSSRTEVLVQHLVRDLCAPGDASVIRPVLLPSRPLVEKVGLALAREQGVAMGVDFLLPGAFFDRVAGALDLAPLDPCWQPEGLFWRLLPLVRAASESPGSRLAAARGEEVALVSLTRQIADRFDQYLHYRPALIQAWDLGAAWDELPEDARADEAWQRELWQGLKRPLKNGPPPPHLVDRFEILKTKLAQSKAAPFGRALEVLSTGPLPGGMLDVLAVLGRGCDVNLRMLMPSREYLRHIKSVARQRRAGEKPDLDREGHPLLASLGRQAVDSFGVLDDLLDREGGDFTVLDKEEGTPGSTARPSLLRTLQEDIRAARQPDPALRPPVADGRDPSLRVHRCHGPRREVEVLRDELTRAFEDLEDLRAEEVLILSPDLKAHAPLAQALLPAPGYGLPLGLSESGITLEDPLLRALTALLRFASGRAALSEGLALLDLEASVRVLGEEEARALASRLEGSGLSFGLDAAHRADLGAGNEALGTWRFGLDRLLQGLWLGAEEHVEGPDSASPCLPQAGALSSGRGEALDALRWVDGLASTARLWSREKQGPAGWADRLRRAADALFSHPDTSEEALAGVLEWLRRAGADLGCETALGPGALADHLDAFARDEERSVRTVGGRLALGGLKPLRALPCRVLALLGLSDPAFPRRDDAPAWDLMAAKHLIGDRDPREEDRQLFLDALLSAKDRVIITAPARHVVTDKPVPFSVCVDELLRCALATGARDPGEREALRKRLVLDHPSQPFTPSNFGADGSFDRANHALAEAVLRERAPRPFSPPRAETRPREPADFNNTDELLRFFKDPAKAWLGALGLRLPREAEEQSRGDDEPLDLEDALLRWQLAQALMEHGEAGAETDASLRRRAERLAADRLLPYGALGQALARDAWDALRGPVQILRERSGGWDRVEAEALLPEGFNGTLRLARKGSSLVHPSASALDGPRLGLELHLRACLAAASGRPLPTLALARLGSGSKAKYVAREIPAVPKAQAEDRLRFLKRAQDGLVRALCFDPDISLALAKLEQGEVLDWDRASPAHPSPSLALLSRDRDPFAGEGWTLWVQEALAVYGPILEWLGRAKEAGHA